MGITDRKQYDLAWGLLPYAGENIWCAGCGPTSDAIITGETPDVVANWMTLHGYASNDSGTYWGGIPAYFRSKGIKAEQLAFGSLYGNVDSKVFDTFKDWIRSGKCGILLMGKGMWASGGHYIPVVDYADDKYLVYDPASEGRTGWHPWADFEGQIKIPFIIDAPNLTAEKNYCYSFAIGSLSRGAQSKGVALLQRLWKGYGIYDGEIDGDYGELTEAACCKWQSIHQLAVDGSCGLQTQCSLLGLMHNSWEHRVKEIAKGCSHVNSTILAQVLLKIEGTYDGAIDGDFGAQTEEAVRTYQRRCMAAGTYDGLPDGVCGKKTWKCLLGLEVL